MPTRSRIPKRRPIPRRLVPESVLRELIEEATVDAHDESEQLVGFVTMLEEHLAAPFQTSVLGAAMAEFLRIDEALLATAAEHSPPVTRRTYKRADINRRVHDLPLKEKEKALADYIAGKPSALLRLQDAVLGSTTSRSGGGGAPRRTPESLIRAAGLSL